MSTGESGSEAKYAGISLMMETEVSVKKVVGAGGVFYWGGKDEGELDG